MTSIPNPATPACAVSAKPAAAQRKPRRMARAPEAKGGNANAAATPPPALLSDSAAAPKPTGTKSAAVIALLSREEGATLHEMVAATGWLPHTTRAALTGLKKKGHRIMRGERGEITCYRIAAA